MTIRVGRQAVVRSFRLPGSHTVYQTIVEWNGQRLPNVYESEDPHEMEHLVAAKLRVILERNGQTAEAPQLVDPTQGIFIPAPLVTQIGRYLLIALFIKACI